MILAKFRESPETRGEAFPCKAFRWTLQASADRSRASFGFVHQYHCRDEWQSSETAIYRVSVSRNWRWGREHVYYDGPHCMLMLGFLRFDWCGSPFTQWCKKCMPDADLD